MDVNYMLDQNNRYQCMGNCTHCPFFGKAMGIPLNSMPAPNYGGMSHISFDGHIEQMVNGFFVYVPKTIFWYDNSGTCYVQYVPLLGHLIEYSRKNYPWKTPIYMEVNFGKVVLVPDDSSYEKYIKDIFKKAIDVAAEVTKYRSPQTSIIFDGMGVVLADNAAEAVKKVISILEKAEKADGFR